MIPLISQLTVLIEFIIDYLLIFLDILFELACNSIKNLFNLFVILIKFCSRVENLVDLLTICANDCLISLEQTLQFIFNACNSIEMLHFASYTFICFALVYYRHRVKNMFKKKDSVEDRLKKFESERLIYICCICGEEFRTIVLMPCKHLCMCESCFSIGYTTTSLMNKNRSLSLFSFTSTGIIKKKTVCPICRSFINDTITVYN